MLYGYRQSHYIHKTDDIYKDFGKDVATRFDTSNYELERPLPKVKKQKKNKKNWVNEREIRLKSDDKI